MNIICIGDVVGGAGREALEACLPRLRKEYDPQAIIVNAENVAGGLGITPRLARGLFMLGCDVITLGDHVWDKADIYPYFEEEPRIIRPANFPAECPGKGWCVYETPSGKKVGVINLLGRVFTRYNTNCPFRELENIVSQIRKQTPIIVVDMHAEATSEKVALGFFIDGRVSAVVGSHTHIQTADERVLPNGTAYITDLGMTGPYDSVIGQNKEQIIKRFLTNMPAKYQVATDNIKLCGAVIEIDEDTGLAKRINRIQMAKEA
jgi:2',3'-cyclic-nucleotide 2'-phosphodiesterase